MKTYIQQICTDTGYHLEDFLIGMDSKTKEPMLSVFYDDYNECQNLITL